MFCITTHKSLGVTLEVHGSTNTRLYYVVIRVSMIERYAQ